MLLHRKVNHNDGKGIDEFMSKTTFIEHKFDIEVGNLDFNSFIRSNLEKKASVLSFPAANERGKLVLNSDTLTDWPFGTRFSFGIEDEKAYVSSVVVRNSELFVRVLNFSSDLKWPRVSFIEEVNLSGHEKTNAGPSISTSGVLENEMFKGSGMTPPDWKGADLKAYKIEYTAMIVSDKSSSSCRDQYANEFEKLTNFKHELDLQ